MKSIRNGSWFIAALVLWSTIAGASTWGGHNGTITLSFSDSTLASVRDGVEPIPGVGAIVDLYAILGDLAPLTWEQEKILAVGGFELQLKIEGCEAKVLSQTFPLPVVNVRPEPGSCQAGFGGALSIGGGSAQLVHWQIQLLGDPRNVKFSLDPAGPCSCAAMEGCPGSGTYAMWAGSVDANQQGLIFSAGFKPAYLNWSDGKPDLSPVRGRTDWSERGLFGTY